MSYVDVPNLSGSKKYARVVGIKEPDIRASFDGTLLGATGDFVLCFGIDVSRRAFVADVRGKTLSP